VIPPPDPLIPGAPRLHRSPRRAGDRARCNHKPVSGQNAEPAIRLEEHKSHSHEL
jgi:hypothetical protein